MKASRNSKCWRKKLNEMEMKELLARIDFQWRSNQSPVHSLIALILSILLDNHTDMKTSSWGKYSKHYFSRFISKSVPVIEASVFLPCFRIFVNFFQIVVSIFEFMCLLDGNVEELLLGMLSSVEHFPIIPKGLFLNMRKPSGQNFLIVSFFGN